MPTTTPRPKQSNWYCKPTARKQANSRPSHFDLLASLVSVIDKRSPASSTCSEQERPSSRLRQREPLRLDYVDNVVHAHLLAADKLSGPAYPADKLGDVMISTRVLADDQLESDRGVPTSEARDDTPDGSTDYARKLPTTLSPETLKHELNVRPSFATSTISSSTS